MLRRLLVLLYFGCAVDLDAASTRKIIFPSAESEFPPNCTFSNGLSGVCMKECEDEAELNASNYQICYFLEGEVYTCCPEKQKESNTAMRLAEESCIKIKQRTDEEGTASQKFSFMFQIGWPHASLSYEYHFECLGVLIWPDYVLTAAHCTYFNGDEPSVVLPANSTDVSELIEISEVLLHADYDGEEVYNDIALLKLEKAVDADFACLWPDNFELPERLLSIGLKQTPNVTNALTLANFTIVTNVVCAESYKVDEYLPNGIVDQQLCAEQLEQQQAANATHCQGDGGGPLLTFATIGGQERAQIIGIASFGKGGSMQSSPTVYTRIAAYLNWLEEQIWPKGNNSTLNY